ncbi:MAG: outer membrane beta-barrel protein [Polyangiaceae bacterium]
MRRIVIAAATLGLTLAATAGTARADDDKKITVGGDLQFVLPIGDMANFTGPQIGVLLRGGYRVIPPLELTGRIGYLFGLDKSQGNGLSKNFSNIPIWVGARYFFMDAPAGLYGAAEVGLNAQTAHASGNVGGVSVSGSAGATREGFNIGAGYVVSQDLPIDIRVQFSDFNLLGTNSGEKAELGIGVSAGYCFFF